MMISAETIISSIIAMFGALGVLSKYAKYLLEKQLEEKQKEIEELKGEISVLRDDLKILNEKFIEISKENIEKTTEIKCVLEKCDKNSFKK